MCSSRPTVWSQMVDSQARFAGRCAGRQGQSAHGRHRSRHRRRAQGDREPRPDLLADRWSTNSSDVARAITTAGELATGAVNKSLKDLEQTLAHRHRPVASGLDHRRHRDAGNQQDPAHRYAWRCSNACVKATSCCRKSSPAPTTTSTRWSARWSPAWRTSCPTMNDVTVAQRRGYPDAGRTAHRVQLQDRRRPWRISARCRRSSKAMARRSWMPPALVEQSNRTTTTSRRRTQGAAGIAGHHHRSAHHRSRSAPRPASPACSTNRWPPPKSAPATSPASCAETAGSGLGSDQPPVRSRAHRRRRRTPRRPRSHERTLPAGHPRSRCDVQAVGRQVRRRSCTA